MAIVAFDREVRRGSQPKMLYVLGFVLFLLLAAKFVDWINSWSRFERDIYYRKAVLEHIYWMLNVAGGAFFESGFNFFFFVSDGYILSQLCTLLFRGEFNFFAFVCSLPVFFALGQVLIAREVASFSQDTASKKMTFVRVIGKHDAVFFYVAFAVASILFSVMDLGANGYSAAGGVVFFLFSMWGFSNLMDGNA